MSRRFPSPCAQTWERGRRRDPCHPHRKRAPKSGPKMTPFKPFTDASALGKTMTYAGLEPHRKPVVAVSRLGFGRSSP